MKISKARAIGVGALGVVLAAGVGGGVAFAHGDGPTTGPTPAPSASSPAGPGHHHGKHDGKKGQRKDLLRRVQHGEFVVGAKKTRTIDVQRGQVVGISGTQISVKSRDGYFSNYAISSATKVHKDRKVAKSSDIANGDRVMVQALRSGSTKKAQRIADIGAKKPGGR